MNLSSLSNPPVMLTVIAIAAMAILLTLAVNRASRNPVRRGTFDQALEVVMGSELDIDVALTRTENEKLGWFEYWARLVENSGRIVENRSTPGRVVIGAMVAAAGFGFLVFPGGIIGLVVAPVVPWLVLRSLLTAEKGKRSATMEKQLPQLLAGLRANLQAGATPQQAMLSVADDLASPLGDEVRTLKRDLNVAVSLEDALAGLAARVPSREMQFLVASVEIAVKSGADLDPQLESIQGIVQQRTRIRQKLRAAVSQVTPTKMLAYGAVPLMLFISMRDSGNRSYWFGGGFFMLIVAGVIYLGAGYIIRSMVKAVENA